MVVEMVELTCAGCGTKFQRPAKEVRRQRKKDPNRDFYCKMPCYGKTAATAHLDGHRPGAAHLDSGNRQDQFSAFRIFLRNARSRKQALDLDLAYLRALWEIQGGRCALSGRPMELPRNTRAWERDSHNPWKPSLDRIDSTKGYVQGNVRFVSMIGNYCKNRFTDTDVIEFCQAVASHHP